VQKGRGSFAFFFLGWTSRSSFASFVSLSMGLSPS
jgi:hypothetical protein